MNSKRKAIEEFCEEDTIFFDGFDDAIVGFAERYGTERVIAYDYDKVIEILMKSGMTYDDAVEYFEFNVIGAYVGEKTPAFITLIPNSNKN